MMERRPAVGSKCGVGILHVCQVKDHHQERSDNNIDCSPSHLAHYIKKTVTVRFILDHPVYVAVCKYKREFQLTCRHAPVSIPSESAMLQKTPKRDGEALKTGSPLPRREKRHTRRPTSRLTDRRLFRDNVMHPALPMTRSCLPIFFGSHGWF